MYKWVEMKSKPHCQPPATEFLSLDATFITNNQMYIRYSLHPLLPKWHIHTVWYLTVCVGDDSLSTHIVLPILSFYNLFQG